MSSQDLSSGRLRVVRRMAAGVSVALAAVLVVCPSSSPRLRAAGAPADNPIGLAATPNPADPFAPKKPEVNPFGPEDPAVAAKRAAEEREVRTQELLSQSMSRLQKLLLQGMTLAKELAADRDDALCVEGSLSLLQAGSQETWVDVDPLELLETIARRRGQPEGGEPAAQALARLRQRLAAAAQPAARELTRLAADYRALTSKYRTVPSKPWPLDWRARQDFWLGLVETIIDSQQATDPAGPWRARIVVDPDHADWYRLGYLAVVRAASGNKHRHKGSFDYEIVRPWIEFRGLISDLHLRRMADVYRTALLASLPEEHPARAESRRRLLHELSERRIMESEKRHALLPALADIYKSDARAGRLVARRLVDRQSPRVFALFAERAGMSRQEQHRWFLGKPVSVAFHDEPLGEALQSLSSEVRVPLWIDQSAEKDPSRVSLETRGRWIDVLESALRGTNCRLELLRPDLLWVGTPEARRGAAELLEKSLARVPDRKTPLGAALAGPSQLEFIETPVQDCIDYMKDLHGIEIVVVQEGNRKFSDTPITLNQKGIPACLALSLVARQAGGDWDVLDNLAVVGPTKQVDELREQRFERLRRDVRLSRAEGSGQVVAEPTRLEFIETPLEDVAAYLADLHGANFTLARTLKPETAMTFNMKGTTLGTALDLMLFRIGLCWDSDGEVIYIGDANAVGAFRAMAAGRAVRLGRYPKELAEKLRRRIARVDFKEAPLAEVVAWLDKNAGVGVGLGQVADATKNENLDLHWKNVPLDALLDVLCLERGLQWRATDRQTVVIEGK